jgi:hypothetical protein
MNFDDGRICPLHPFRLGKNPNRPKREFSAKQKAHLFTRKQPAEMQAGVREVMDRQLKLPERKIQ